MLALNNTDQEATASGSEILKSLTSSQKSRLQNFLNRASSGTFKTECLYRYKPATGEQVQQLVDEYIQFYNCERIDMKYGLTPFEIRSKAA